MIYIYTLSHPLTNEVRYVGKTINLKRRYKQHLYDKRGKHKVNWIQSLKRDGLKPVLTVIEECTENWQEREKYWITQYDNLTNFLDGGGVDYVRVTSDETREKIRQANKGKSLSEEHKKKIQLKAKKQKVSIDGVIYESVSDASKLTGFGWTTIYSRVKSNTFPSYYYC